MFGCNNAFKATTNQQTLKFYNCAKVVNQFKNIITIVGTVFQFCEFEYLDVLILCIVGQYCMTVFALCVDWHIGIRCFCLEQTALHIA